MCTQRTAAMGTPTADSHFFTRIVSELWVVTHTDADVHTREKLSLMVVCFVSVQSRPPVPLFSDRHTHALSVSVA